MSDWLDPGWRSAADEWIVQQLDRIGLEPVGPFDQMHDRPWSTVIRVPTQAGNVFFKAVASPLRHEVALTELLGARRPDCIPPPLAVDLDRGWMLLEDGGRTLRDVIADERDLGRWADVLPLYAGVQIDLVGDVHGLLELGVPDLRLEVLPGKVEELLDEVGDLPADERGKVAASLPWVREACAELCAAGIPETIQHDDLHDAQVFVRDGRYLLLDWGDACVSHPFFSLAVTLDGVIAWGVDDVQGSAQTEPFRGAYLAPFRGRTSSDLVAASATARRLGWLCRAVNGRLSQPRTRAPDSGSGCSSTVERSPGDAGAPCIPKSIETQRADTFAIGSSAVACSVSCVAEGSGLGEARPETEGDHHSLNRHHRTRGRIAVLRRRNAAFTGSSLSQVSVI